MMDDNNIINEYFDTLEDWKQLPAYRLEVRIDSLIGFVLPKVLESDYGLTKIIIPELPLRLGTVMEDDTIHSPNRSFKVDFYIRTVNNKNIFIEIKSDSDSEREGQHNYLHRCTLIKMRAIIEGIIQIAEVTSYKYKPKYKYLLNKLVQGGLVKKEDNNYICNIDDEDIEVIFVKPDENDEDIVNNRNVITFIELSNEIESIYPNSEFLQRFANSLQLWKDD